MRKKRRKKNKGLDRKVFSRRKGLARELSQDAWFKQGSQEFAMEMMARVDEYHELSVKAGYEETLNRAKAGMALNDLQAAIRKEMAGKWGRFMEINYPHIHKRRYQRYMYLGHHLALEGIVHEQLCLLGQKRLLSLIAVALAVKKEEGCVAELLEENEVRIPEADDVQGVRDFKAAVDELIEQTKAESEVEEKDAKFQQRIMVEVDEDLHDDPPSRPEAVMGLLVYDGDRFLETADQVFGRREELSDSDIKAASIQRVEKMIAGLEERLKQLKKLVRVLRNARKG